MDSTPLEPTRRWVGYFCGQRGMYLPQRLSFRLHRCLCSWRGVVLKARRRTQTSQEELFLVPSTEPCPSFRGFRQLIRRRSRQARSLPSEHNAQNLSGC